MPTTLNNARQLHLATQTMSLDTFNTNGNGTEWTSKLVEKKPVQATLSEYFAALTNNHYLTDSDLRKLLTAPGKTPRRGDPLITANIAFKFFWVEEKSPAAQPLLVTANWQPGGLTDEDPYGKKGFVVFAKGGSGGVYQRAKDATRTNIFPSGSLPGADTVPYRYDTLK